MASTGEEVDLKKMDKTALVIQLVAAMLGTSSTMTIGDWNNKCRMSRVFTWIELVYVMSCLIASMAATSYVACTKPSSWENLYPWGLLVSVMVNVYVAVLYLALRCLSLFVPQAPFAAWECLKEVGFKGIGSVIGAWFLALLLFDQPWLHMHFACLVGVLIAAVLAFWVWLVRTYGDNSPSPVTA